ncbi:Uu.00g114890.m01.CDS01 [Anthostomella pinea]|uniref:Uu.00g114890.m01.CDS01 n=1 Tax=Anthostomella pinea TaxID=933095 RepID=A0AAI8YGL1_9PEZI|nr:Uu.00g114890.m01.CDS01 [Anthostomella pinea]
MVNAVSFTRTIAEQDIEYSITTLFSIDGVITQKKKESMLNDDDNDLRRKAEELVPRQYHDHLDVFSKVRSDELSPSRPGVDHKIDLVGKPEDLGYSPLYKMSLEEMEACRKYIVKNL